MSRAIDWWNKTTSKVEIFASFLILLKILTLLGVVFIAVLDELGGYRLKKTKIDRKGKRLTKNRNICRKFLNFFCAQSYKLSLFVTESHYVNGYLKLKVTSKRYTFGVWTTQNLHLLLKCSLFEVFCGQNRHFWHFF